MESAGREELDIDACRTLDSIFGRQGASGLRDRKDELVSLFAGWIVKLLKVFWISCSHNRRTLVLWTPREALPELFGQERHEGMNQCEAPLESGVEGLFGRFLFERCPILNDSFRVFDVDVAKMVKPIFVCNLRCLGEIACSESSVDICSGGVQLVENPELGEGFLTDLCRMTMGFKDAVVDFA